MTTTKELCLRRFHGLFEDKNPKVPENRVDVYFLSSTEGRDPFVMWAKKCEPMITHIIGFVEEKGQWKKPYVEARAIRLRGQRALDNNKKGAGNDLYKEDIKNNHVWEQSKVSRRSYWKPCRGDAVTRDRASNNYGD